MVDFGVDDNARKQLFCLAQLNWQGYEAANTIVSKISKNEQYGQAYKNISGFVSVAVKNARDRIQAGYAAWKPEDVDARIGRQGGENRGRINRDALTRPYW